nr:hypothetical protein [Tanacetum cinerariifolium]
ECQIVDNCKKGLGYNAVPPPHTGLFPPPKADLSSTGLEELFNESKTENSTDKSNKVEPESVRKHIDAPIIEDWVSNDEEEEVEQKEVKPCINRINFIKATTYNNPKETVKTGEQIKQNTYKKRGNQRNWNGMMSHRAIHTVKNVADLLAKAFNVSSSTMASAAICLANNQKFNFSKYILDNLKKNLEAGVPFYMFSRFIQENTHMDHVPTTSNDPLPGGEDRMQLKELMDLCINLSNKVLDLENTVIEMKSSHKVKIEELESKVEKLEEENRSLTKELKSFNTKVESLAIKETIMDKEESSKYGRKITDIDADVKEVAKEMVEVITTAKIIIGEVSTGGGKLNVANEEQVSVAPTNITRAQPSEATKTTVDIATAPKAKGIVFHDKEKSTTRIASSKSQVKDKGKAKLVEEPKILKSRKAQIAIDEEVARRIEAE